MLTLLSTALIAVAQPEPDLGWMAGYWLDCGGGREASETWSDPRAGLMVGHAVTVDANGAPSFEVSHITAIGGDLAYVAQPQGAPPTVFRLSESEPSRAVFFSATSDFPSWIVYQRDGERLTARIEGQVDGRSRSLQWTFEAKPLNSRCPARPGGG